MVVNMSDLEVYLNVKTNGSKIDDNVESYNLDLDNKELITFTVTGLKSTYEFEGIDNVKYFGKESTLIIEGSIE